MLLALIMTIVFSVGIHYVRVYASHGVPPPRPRKPSETLLPLEDAHTAALDEDSAFENFKGTRARFYANVAAGNVKICPKCRDSYTWTCERCAGYVPVDERA